MKYISALLLFMAAVLPSFGNETDSTFFIKGYLAGEKGERKVFLRYNQTIDTVVMSNGRFEFRGYIKTPAMAGVWLEAENENERNSSLNFYLEATRVYITSLRSLSQAVVQAGQTEVEQQLFKKLIEPWGQKRSNLYVRKETHRENKDSLRIHTRAMAELNKEYNKLQLNFIKKFPDSYISYELVKSNSYAIEPAVLEPMLESLGERFKKSAEISDIYRRLEIAKATWIGKPALDFTQNDVNGKPVSLKSFRGKYVLVDFWASWCGWCRIEHPNFIEAYKKYKDNGFTILSVSLDDAKDRDKWIEAIEKDGLIWTQVSDLKGRENEAAKLYGIKGIPQNVIVGPDGVIVAKNLRGDDLLLKLEELFGY